MNREQLKEKVRIEIEAEARSLEKKVMEDDELSSIEMPEDSYLDLKIRIKALKKTEKKKFRFYLRPRIAVAMITALVIITSAGVSGAKLFVPRVENREKDGGLDVFIDNDDYIEEEAYEEIEDKLGILALRLGYKPEGMELEKSYIDTNTGEAMMEFYYQDSILTIYENKQNSRSYFVTQPDGKIVDTIELFYTGQELEILEIDKIQDKLLYRVQLQENNAYYYLSSDVELEEFKNILQGIFFKSV
ncbi:MAG: DUF4367 domain-containing protein [Lachnospiraceae bacterium]|jgi:hypothetical protein|nr:DUF4367 domain-containing protein [Lachnospiraceae bacterium]